MTAVDNYFPFDSGPGYTATMSRWRLMGRLFCGSGVIPGFQNQFATTVSGGVATIQPGGVWIDGFYGETTANKALTVSGNGMIVARMDPTSKTITIVYVLNQTLPTQSLTGIFEIPLYTVAAGAVTDARQFALADPNKVARVRMHRVAGYTTNTTDVRYGFDTITWGGSAPGGLFTCPYAADYLVSCQGGFHTTAAGQYYNIEINHNGTNVAWNGTNNAVLAGAVLVARCTDIIPCKAGDTLSMYHHCSTVGLQGMVGYPYAYMTIRAMS